ncbi:MAG: substrate-binding domain-containing protein [Gemmatimonadaceae bacterium]|nr:substrate-binding domain-containing protein [Gemmatimonadaceae bacterium]
MHGTRYRRRLLAVLIVLAGGCGREAPATDAPLTVFAAGSLARPLRAALDSVVASGGPPATLEIMGSREMLRAVTSLHRIPDLVVTADADEMERTLLPSHITASTTFARNRVVLALSRRLAGGDTVTTRNWAAVMASGALRVARTDPARAPLGYRTQLVWILTEAARHEAGLAQRLAAASPAALVRGNESDLAALLESGDADAAWCYESLARALGLRYVTLGSDIDLGSTAPADVAGYAQARVRVPGAAPGDSIEMTGTPIRYGIAVLTGGIDPVRAAVLRERLLDADSRRIMRRAGLDVLDSVHVTRARDSLHGAP